MKSSAAVYRSTHPVRTQVACLRIMNAELSSVRSEEGKRGKGE